MTAYTVISDTSLDPDAPITSSLGYAFRNNLIAFMEGDASIGDANRQRVLLGIIATTSGSTVTLSSLDLTNYRTIIAVFNGVSLNITGGVKVAGIRCTSNLPSTVSRFYGVVWIDLFTGIFGSFVGDNSGGGSSAFGGSTGYSTSTTSISFSATTGNFDDGSISIYGCK